jgi:hypothetical protein
VGAAHDRPPAGARLRPPFISARWDLKRHHVKNHRDNCLTEERRKAIRDGLLSKVKINGSE